MRIASECLFFTNMEEVAVGFSDAVGNSSRRWSVETSLNPIPGDTDHLTIHTITEREDGESVRESQWLVARNTIDDPSLGPPRSVQDAINAGRVRVRTPAVAGVAVALYLPADSTTEYKYFSDLPVTERTGIQAHLMASFVLSPDRRQIRFDQNNVVELEYNQWLLSYAIPPLYLEVLEYLARCVPEPETDNGRWWPQERKTETIPPLTAEFKKAFYGRHLRETHRYVFNSKFCPAVICSPRDAILLDNEPPFIRSLLEKMGATNLVELGEAVREQVHEEAGVAVVKQEVLAYQLRSRPDVITSQFWETDGNTLMKDLEQVLRYLIHNDNPEHIIGLPLLPLANGTFGTFDRSTATSPTYFVWKRLNTTDSPVFPPERFVHHSLSGKRSGINEVLHKVNVRKLSADDVVRMLGERFDGARELVYASTEDSTFIFNFWKAIGRGLEDGDDDDQHPIVSSLDLFPLVPTSHDGSYVSLRHCRTGQVLVLNQEGFIHPDILDCLSVLGLHFITTYSSNFPPRLREILIARALPSFDNILDALEQVGGVVEAFHRLHPDQQLVFSHWARDNMVNISSEKIRIARLLPIWPAARGHHQPYLAAALDTSMLPEGLDYETTAPFLDITVSDHGLLGRLEGPSLTPEAVISRLRLPPTLPIEGAQSLVQLLYTLLHLAPPNYVEPIPIPNTNLVFIPSNQLFAREPLFIAAFGEDSINFVAREFAGIEALLIKHGLRSSQTLGIAGYQTCAEAIDALPDNAADKITRAEVVWNVLPDIVRREEHLVEGDTSFAVLANLRFVPRDTSTTRRVGDQVSIPLPEGITQLPGIVSPNQLVLANMEPIAWSQRARFATQPGALVTSFWRTLGQPQVSDAVRLNLCFYRQVTD